MTPEAACGPQGCRGFHDGYFGPQQSWGDLSAPMGCVSGMCYWRVTSAFFPYGCSDVRFQRSLWRQRMGWGRHFFCTNCPLN